MVNHKVAKEADVRHYESITAAVVDYLKLLESMGEFNSTDLERQLWDKGVSKDDILSAPMIRQLKSGQARRITEPRILAAARAWGIEVMIVNRAMPDAFKAPPDTWKKPKK